MKSDYEKSISACHESYCLTKRQLIQISRLSHSPYENALTSYGSRYVVHLLSKTPNLKAENMVNIFGVKICILSLEHSALL